MSRETPLVRGRWRKATKYSILDGRIRPEPGAEIVESDAWESYWEARRAKGRPDGTPGKRGSMPHYALIETLDSTGLRGGLPHSIGPEASDAVLQWVNEFGLLGVLPWQLDVIRLAPRWTKLHGLESSESAQLGATQEVIFRRGGSWFSASEVYLDPFARMPRRAREGDLVHATTPEGVAFALCRSLSPMQMAPEPLSLREAVYPFFPDVPAEEADTYRYPTPFTDDFWRSYSEPLDTFLQAARLFSDLRILREIRSKEKSDGIRAGAENVAGREETVIALANEQLGLLDWLLSPVQPSVYVGERGVFQQEWGVPSLLSLLAMMVLEDLTANRPVKSCKNQMCGMLFTAGQPNSEYCSRKCMSTAGTRARRGKNKKKPSTRPRR